MRHEGGVRGRARAQAAQQGDARWVVAGFTALGLLVCGFTVAHGQTTVPEVVKPRSESPTLPPTVPDRGTTVAPRSENPLADSGSARPIPDTGVIAPPPAAGGSTPVIRPPSMGTMPVIPPPGSAGGDRTVVPK